MDTSVAQNIIQVIRAERDSRLASLKIEDRDLWMFTDEPFINELCLTLLVAIRHHVERSLVLIAARVTSDGRELSSEDYWQRIKIERERLRSCGWGRLIAKLQLDSLADWNLSMKTLQLLANSYKHDPSTSADEGLLRHLGLPLDVTYASLPESPGVKAGVAASLGLQDSADYCDIAEALLVCVSRFTAEVEARLVLSPVKGGEERVASMLPNDMLH
jgi:hypothetical protein